MKKTILALALVGMTLGAFAASSTGPAKTLATQKTVSIAKSDTSMSKKSAKPAKKHVKHTKATGKKSY